MAQICTNCKFACNPDNAINCQQCNSLLSPSVSIDEANENISEQESTVSTPTTSAEILTPKPCIPSANQNQLIGRVTWIENAMENVDFNVYKFCTQLSLFLLFIPLLALIFVISTALWIAFAILGFRSLSRDVSPFNIANTLNSFGILIAVVFPRLPQRNQVPVFRLTIQTDQGERPALVKGEMTSGTFRMGDEIELTGEWRRGTLIVKNGYNRSLQTSIAIRGDYWMYGFLFVLSLFALIGIYFLRGIQ